MKIRDLGSKDGGTTGGNSVETSNKVVPLPPTGRPKSFSASAKAKPAKANSGSDDSDDDSSDDSDKSAKSSTKKISASDSSSSSNNSSAKSSSGTKRDASNTDNSKNTSSGNSQDDSSAAQSQADSDVKICTQWQNRAQTCCGNPTACLSTNDQNKVRQQVAQLQTASDSGDAAGLTQTCQQMQQTGDNGSSINQSFAAACTTNQSSCSNTCAQLQQKYYNLMNSCGADCQNSGIYSAAYNRISSGRNSCDNLSARADSLSRQGLQASSSAYGQYCSGMSQASPQSVGGLPSAAANAAASVGSQANCQSNPNLPGCAQTPAAVTQFSINKGQGGYTTASKTANKFNLGDTADATAGSSGFAPQASTNGSPAKAGIVPNGGGGGIGGAGGGGGAPTGGGSGGGSRSSAGSPGYSTDIDRGLRSGGGYSAAGGSPTSSSVYGREPASQNLAASPLVGTDLKQFLPGGSRDPSRRLAGAMGGSQINLKEEDIWRRISNKIVEKCRLGELWQCQ